MIPAAQTDVGSRGSPKVPFSGTTFMYWYCYITQAIYSEGTIRVTNERYRNVLFISISFKMTDKHSPLEMA